MKKIKKFQFGGLSLANPQNLYTNFNLKPPTVPLSYYTATNTPIPNYSQQFQLKNLNQSWNLLGGSTSSTSSGNSIAASAIDAFGSVASNFLSDKMFGDSEVGLNLGSIFGSALGSTTSTISSNIIKGTSLMEGLGKNVGASVGGAASGIAGNYIGKGISAAFGDSAVGRGIGAGIGTAIGGIGGMGFQALSQGKNFFNAFQVAKNASAAAHAATKAAEIANAGKSITEVANAATQAGKAAATASKLSNLASIGGLAGSVVGAGLLAAFGPSKEYGGRYGNVTQIADTAYDAAQAVVGFMGPAGSLVSGMMALNKGLSNVFGSTDGMTLQDSILGSAWMPAPVKWLNMAAARTTGSFDNQSWLNTERTKAFMQNAFGDISERFDTAREEAGKTYGTFSQKAYRKALRNLDFANSAWGKILDMTDLNEYQNIRSLLMSSINNQRYAQDIQGGWTPLYRGKQGMKILNNATNHNIGMRLLSGAALVDSKQMILCSAVN